MVCFYHFTSGSAQYLPDSNILKQIFVFGPYGVQIFFVISGFILPYSLNKVNYDLHDFPKFFLKRFFRLEPPYIACILLVVVLGYVSTLSPYYRGSTFHIDYVNLLFHFGYVNSFLDEPWINPVFWTLAIEFQFYIILGLSFPYIKSSSRLIQYLLLIALLAVSLITKNQALIFYHAPFFIIGILTFLFFERKIGRNEFCIVLLFALCFVFFNFSVLGVVVSLFSLVWILFVRGSNRVLVYVGNISYSLYLLHTPIGMRVINISEALFSSEMIRSLMVVTAYVITFIAAVIFYLLIERVGLNYSKRIQY